MANLLSRLEPDSATQVGILSAIGVYLIYNNALPSIADIRQAPPHDNDVESARKAAAWKSAGLVALVFIVARDLNSFIISGAALIGLDYMYKHHNAVQPTTQTVDTSSVAAPSAYPLPEYAS